MMGRREGGQGQFFYSFDLDEVVPPDHLTRQCPPSALARQNGWIEEGMVSGSS
jgi:hypothetical protein